MRLPSIRDVAPLLAGLPLLIILPLAGVWLAGYPVHQYLEFPPVTRYVAHAGFSWPVFIALAALIVAVVGPFVWRNVRGAKAFRIQGSGFRKENGSGIHNLQSSISFPLPITNRQSSIFNLHFPPWGWFGLLLGLVAWILAWTRFAWFAPLQDFTFSPLWFAYILVVNALTVRRTGRCLMTDRPASFALLFPLSAAFWWFFEFLNRFVQNWYYVGIGDLSPLQYAIFATLPFSTVLPAVLSTEDFLRSFPTIGRGVDGTSRFAPIRTPACLPGERRGFPRRLFVTVSRHERPEPEAAPLPGATARQHGDPCPRIIPAATLLLAAAGLAGIGVWPDRLFPLLWLSPLLVMTSAQALAGRPTLFAPVARGDWNRLYRLALAALICGFFWEMWNYGSLARWSYTVPFVNRFHLFEMPILGYAGYVPFGLECAVAAELVVPHLLPANGPQTTNEEPGTKNRDLPET